MLGEKWGRGPKRLLPESPLGGGQCLPGPLTQSGLGVMWDLEA